MKAALGVGPLLLIEPDKRQPRNSEGDIIELKDGRLCLVYARFTGGAADESAADLAMRTSNDGGKSWSKDRIIVRNEGKMNVMSVSLLRLWDGRIALFYLRKQSPEDCRPVMRISADEGKTWSGPRMCITDEVGYYVLNNDRAVQLSGGRLVLPVAQHCAPKWKHTDWDGVAMCYLSDDNGKTWRRSRNTLRGKTPAGERITLQEPGVVELSDGRLMLYCRTSAGSQYVSHSKDGGETWAPVRPSKLASPLSPATIERIPWTGDLMCVWNDHTGAHPFPDPDARTPLCVAVSKDDGKTWEKSRAIETDRAERFAYASITFVGDRAILTYSTYGPGVGHLARLKVVALSRDRLCGPARKAKALRQRCLDYGRSFVNTKANWNSPRFWVESRCRISDPEAKKTVEYVQCGSCKSENTFGERDLFWKHNYDFLPVFSEDECVIFRRCSRVKANYREVKPVAKAWGGTILKLRKVKGRVLTSPSEAFAAMKAGVPVVGQTELRDGKTGRTAIIEYPVKTINWHRDKKVWQVDTGPVLLPDLPAPPEQWAEKIRLAYIAFREPQFAAWADFVVEEETAIMDGKKETARVYHYSGLVHRKARNVLLALDEGGSRK